MWSDPQFINLRVLNLQIPLKPSGSPSFPLLKENSFSISEYDAMSHLKKGDAFPLQPTPLFPLAYRTTRSIVLGIKSTPQKELYIYVFSGTEEISIGMYFEGVYPGRWNIGLNRGAHWLGGWGGAAGCAQSSLRLTVVELVWNSPLGWELLCTHT